MPRKAAKRRGAQEWPEVRAEYFKNASKSTNSPGVENFQQFILTSNHCAFSSPQRSGQR